jgi:hypothetical protein
MTGVREHFNDLRDPKIKMEIALVDDTIVRVAGHGTITFQSESPFRLGMCCMLLG